MTVYASSSPVIDSKTLKTDMLYYLGKIQNAKTPNEVLNYATAMQSYAIDSKNSDAINIATAVKAMALDLKNGKTAMTGFKRELEKYDGMTRKIGNAPASQSATQQQGGETSFTMNAQDQQLFNDAVAGLEKNINTLEQYGAWDNLKGFTDLGRAIDDDISTINNKITAVKISSKDEKTILEFGDRLAKLGIAVKAGMETDQTTKNIFVQISSTEKGSDNRAAKNFADQVAVCMDYMNYMDRMLHSYAQGLEATDRYSHPLSKSGLDQMMKDFKKIGSKTAREYAIRALYGNNLEAVYAPISSLGNSTASASFAGSNASMTEQYLSVVNLIKENPATIQAIKENAYQINPAAVNSLFGLTTGITLPDDLLKTGTSETRRKTFDIFTAVAGLNLINNNPNFSMQTSGIDDQLAKKSNLAALLAIQTTWNGFSDLFGKAQRNEVNEAEFETQFKKVMADMKSQAAGFTLNSMTEAVNRITQNTTILESLGASNMWKVAKGTNKNAAVSQTLLESTANIDAGISMIGNEISGSDRMGLLISLVGSNDAPFQKGEAFWLFSKPKVFENIYRGDYSMIDLASKDAFMAKFVQYANNIYQLMPADERVNALLAFVSKAEDANFWSDSLLANYANRMFRVNNGVISVNSAGIVGANEIYMPPSIDYWNVLASLMPRMQFDFSSIYVPKTPGDIFNESVIPYQLDAARTQLNNFREAGWMGVRISDIVLMGLDREYAFDSGTALAKLDEIYSSMLEGTKYPGLFRKTGSLQTGGAVGKTQGTVDEWGGSALASKSDKAGANATLAGAGYTNVNDKEGRFTSYQIQNDISKYGIFKDGVIDAITGNATGTVDTSPDLIYGKYSWKSVTSDINQALNLSPHRTDRLLVNYNRHYNQTEIMGAARELLFSTDATGNVPAGSPNAAIASDLKLSQIISAMGDGEEVALVRTVNKQDEYYVAKKTANGLEIYSPKGQKDTWYQDDLHAYYRIAGTSWVEMNFSDDVRNQLTEDMSRQLGDVSLGNYVKNYFVGGGSYDKNAVQVVGGTQVRDWNEVGVRQATDVGVYLGLGSNKLLGKESDKMIIGGKTVDDDIAAAVARRGKNHMFSFSYYEIDGQALQGFTGQGAYGQNMGSYNTIPRLGQVAPDRKNKQKIAMWEQRIGRMAGTAPKGEPIEGTSIVKYSLAVADQGFAGGRFGYQSKNYTNDVKGKGSLLKAYGYFTWTEKDEAGQKTEPKINSMLVGTEGEFRNVNLTYSAQYVKYPNSSQEVARGVVTKKFKGKKEGKGVDAQLSVNYYNPKSQQTEMLRMLEIEKMSLASAYSNYINIANTPGSSSYDKQGAMRSLSDKMNAIRNNADYQQYIYPQGNTMADITMALRTEDGKFSGQLTLSRGTIAGREGTLLAAFVDFNQKTAILLATDVEAPGKAQAVGVAIKAPEFKLMLMATRFTKDEAQKEIEKLGVRAGVAYKDMMLDMEASPGNDFYRVQFTHAGKDFTYMLNYTKQDKYFFAGAKGILYANDWRYAIGGGLAFYKDVVEGAPIPFQTPTGTGTVIPQYNANVMKTNVEFEAGKISYAFGRNVYSGFGARWERVADPNSALGKTELNQFFFYGRIVVNF